MNKIDVYSFVNMFYQGKEITVHGWYHDEDGKECCMHRTYTDRCHDDFYRIWKGFNVIQFKTTKKGYLDIIADNF